VYYFGQTKTLSEDGASASEHAHTVMLGAEAGYDIKLFGLLTLRPQLGLGNNERYVTVQGTAPITFPATSSSAGFLYLEPALVGLVTLRFFYVGAAPEQGTANGNGNAEWSFDVAKAAAAGGGRCGWRSGSRSRSRSGVACDRSRGSWHSLMSKAIVDRQRGGRTGAARTGIRDRAPHVGQASSFDAVGLPADPCWIAAC
jgi:hypothetical protein